MNSRIEEANKEFDDGNYEKTLEILDGLEVEESSNKLVLIIKLACLRGLKRFDEALDIINSGIEEFPYDDFFWAQKVRCHYFNDQNVEARKSLAELERIVDKDDKYALVCVSELFNLLGDAENALKYCDRALAIDENFEEAVRQKAMIASFIDDHGMMSDCADRLLELYDDDALKLMIPLMLKIFSKRYDDALSIVNGVDLLDDENEMFLKSAILTQMTKDLNIEIRTSKPLEITIDEVLNILMDYHYRSVESGMIRGVQYVVIKTE